MKINRNLKYSLVLSGGGARGLVHVGVLCAMEEAGYPPPSLIAGTSMGAIVGGLYASGMKAQAIKRYVLDELDIGDFMESPVFRMDGPLGKIFQTGQIIGNVATRPGIDSGTRVLRLLEKLTGLKKIEDCGIPFLCNAVDLSAGREVIFRSGSLARAVRASMSFPFFFEPLIDGDLCLVDGGVADNLPVKSAREVGRKLGIKNMLAVDTRRWRNVPADSFKTSIFVVMRCFEAMVHVSETDERSEETAAPPNLVLHAADKTSAFDFSRKRELLRLGEEAVHRSVTELETFFGAGFRAALSRRRSESCGIQSDSYF
ncbi:MAG: patatin-like phospholipase family protein [Treponema sp.]|jgi:NTE family protein|nr:patatin-like phospholipase family protein [Treponema sp.]